MTPAVRTIGLIGAGTVGASWAAFFAAKGFEVNLYDVDPQQALQGRRQAAGRIQDLVSKDLAPSGSSPNEIADRIKIMASLEQAASNADYIQESVAEDYHVKKDVFSVLDQVTSPRTVLASSSSGLLMSEIQTAVSRPERCLVAHPFNPPHLVPLVELVPGPRTAPETVAITKQFFKDLGKTPVVLKREIPGHIANRLAAALWREAMDLVLSGVASVEDVDQALCAGPGLRWAFMGQHLIYHLGGGSGGLAAFIDHLAPAFEMWWPSLAEWKSFPTGAKEQLVAGVEAEMAGRDFSEVLRWRDEKLIGVLKAVRE